MRSQNQQLGPFGAPLDTIKYWPPPLNAERPFLEWDLEKWAILESSQWQSPCKGDSLQAQNTGNDRLGKNIYSLGMLYKRIWVLYEPKPTPPPSSQKMWKKAHFDQKMRYFERKCVFFISLQHQLMKKYLKLIRFFKFPMNLRSHLKQKQCFSDRHFKMYALIGIFTTF